MRAPYTLIVPENDLMQFTPARFSGPWAPLLTWYCTSSAPRMTSLAGALCTPRSASLRA